MMLPAFHECGLLTRLAPKVHWPLIAIGVTGASGVLGYHARDEANLPQNLQLGKNYFRHFRFFFCGYDFAMSYADQLKPFSAAQIIAATGCPRGTAYDWKDGRREPPAWQQPHWLSIISRDTRQKSNKSVMPTAARRESGRAKRSV